MFAKKAGIKTEETQLFGPSSDRVVKEENGLLSAIDRASAHKMLLSKAMSNQPRYNE